MSKTVISVENLTKRYDLGVIGTGTLSRDLNRWWARMRKQPDPYTPIGQEDRFKRLGDSILALDDVSFTVQQGEALGIIGRNGAGKSTLLKILSRVTAPTSGVVKVKGRIGSLLEVGTGFHPELTGRENVFLNGAILGMRKDEVQKKFDEIVDFSGVEKFIDTPVKRYSSGMYVRLAFAVAAHLDPEILVIDEVLAVGDAEFQKKCLGKMGDVANEGRTVLFVSHNMAAIENLCKRCLVLNDGKIVLKDSSEQAIYFYLKQFSLGSSQLLVDRKDREGSGILKITKIYVKNSENDGSIIKSGDRCTICFEYKTIKRLNNVSIAYTIRDERSQFLFRPSSSDTGEDFSEIPTEGVFECKIDRLPLIPGKYRITPRVTVNGEVADYVEGAAYLNVESGDFYGTGKLERHSPVLIDHHWRVIGR